MPYPLKDEEKKLDAAAMSKGLVTASSPEDAVEKAKAMMDQNGNSPVVSTPVQPMGKPLSPMTGTQLEQVASPMHRFGGTMPQPGDPNNLNNWLNSPNSKAQLPISQIPSAVSKSFSENSIKPEAAPNQIDSAPFTPIVPIPKAPANSTLPSAIPNAPAPFKPVVPIPSAPANSTLPGVSDPQHPAKDESDRFYRLTHTKYNPLSPADRDSMAQLQGSKAVPEAVKAENPSWDPTMSIKQWRATQQAPATPVVNPSSTTPTITVQDALKPSIAGVPTSAPTTVTSSEPKVASTAPAVVSSANPAALQPGGVSPVAQMMQGQPAGNYPQPGMRPVYDPKSAGEAAMGKVNPFVQNQLNMAYERAATMKDPTARANYLAQVTRNLGEVQSAFAQRAINDEARRAGLVQKDPWGNDMTITSRPYAGQVTGMTDQNGKNIDAQINNVGAPSQGSVTFGKPTAEQMVRQHLDDLDTNKAIQAQDRAFANGTDMSGHKIVDQDQYGMGHVRQPDKAMQNAIANGTYNPKGVGNMDGVKGEQYLQQNSQDMYRRGLTNEGSPAGVINQQINERIRNGQGFGDLLKQLDQAAKSPDFNRSKVTPEYVKGDGRDPRDPYAGSQIDPRSLDVVFGKQGSLVPQPPAPTTEKSSNPFDEKVAAETKATEDAKIAEKQYKLEGINKQIAALEQEAKNPSERGMGVSGYLGAPNSWHSNEGRKNEYDELVKQRDVLAGQLANPTSDTKSSASPTTPNSPQPPANNAPGVSVKEAINPSLSNPATGFSFAPTSVEPAATDTQSSYALPSPKEQELAVQEKAAEIEKRNAPIKASEAQRWGNYYASQAMEKATADQPNGDPIHDAGIAANIAAAAKKSAALTGRPVESFLPNEHGFNATNSTEKINDLARAAISGANGPELINKAVSLNSANNSITRQQNEEAVKQAAGQEGIQYKGDMDQMKEQLAEVKGEAAQARQGNSDRNYNKSIALETLKSIQAEKAQAMRDFKSNDLNKLTRFESTPEGKAYIEKIKKVTKALNTGTAIDPSVFEEPEVDTTDQQGQSGGNTPQPDIVQAKSPEEVKKLPPGTRFVLNGRTGTVPSK